MVASPPKPTPALSGDSDAPQSGLTQPPASSVPNSAMRNFASEHKSDPGYLDEAANAHGVEKGLLMCRALNRLPTPRPEVVEVGPGGGAAVSYLASQLGRGQSRREVNLTLIEAPGVVSQSLTAAMQEFNQVGTCVLRHGLAQDLADHLPQPVDVISTSALLHEVYSYGGGYRGLHTMVRTLPRVLRPQGCFAYRDVYAVPGSSLHEPASQVYDGRSWLLFLRMFLPQYLRDGTHPYHRADDEVLVRQNSRIVPIDAVKTTTSAFIAAPIGLFREIQRHYITFRDHVWRAGVLGFAPILEGQLASDWIDFRSGHKRVHYTFSEGDWLPQAQKEMLLAMSEPYADHHVIDGDLFDEVTEVALTAFLAAAEGNDTTCAEVWASWLLREGRETYAYLTMEELLTAVAVHSVHNDSESNSVLLPISPNDLLVRQRHYYNRFLARKLANPLPDAKQLVLFQNIPLNDTAVLRQALETLQGVVGKASLAHVYTAINSRG